LPVNNVATNVCHQIWRKSFKLRRLHNLEQITYRVRSSTCKSPVLSYSLSAYRHTTGGGDCRQLSRFT